MMVKREDERTGMRGEGGMGRPRMEVPIVAISQLACCWLTGCPLAGWLIGWLAGAGWLARWLAGSLYNMPKMPRYTITSISSRRDRAGGGGGKEHSFFICFTMVWHRIPNKK